MTDYFIVEGKLVGCKHPLFPEECFPVPRDAEGLTLRDLITQVVLTEVVAFHHRQEERRIPRVLSAEAIQKGVQQGKVVMGVQDPEQEPQTVDPQAAVDTAILGFLDGLYFVFVDDVHYEDLDQPVVLQANSRVTFLRLVALVGG